MGEGERRRRGESNKYKYIFNHLATHMHTHTIYACMCTAFVPAVYQEWSLSVIDGYCLVKF